MLRVTSLSYGTGARTVVKDISFNAADGSKTALFGRSGAGKTTVLKLLAGTIGSESGQATLNGHPLHRPGKASEAILVWQEHLLFDHISVKENIWFGLRARGIPEREMRMRTESILAALGLSGYETRFPATLSGGEKARVAFARAYVLEPSILMLDEVFSNLDRKTRNTIFGLVDDYLKVPGRYAIFVSHEYDDIVSYADGVVVIEQGAVKEASSLQELLVAPKTVYGALLRKDRSALPVVTKKFDGRRLLLDGGFGSIWAASASQEKDVAVGTQGFFVFSRDDALLRDGSEDGDITGRVIRVIRIEDGRHQIVVGIADARVVFPVSRDDLERFTAGQPIYIRVGGAFFPA